ncbi:MAG TPA: hypothetical protein VFS21_16475 [Roseiflexaceae bacterium]|nr:hypothetical protein [Roseiflexaceae bacterium]
MPTLQHVLAVCCAALLAGCNNTPIAQQPVPATPTPSVVRAAREAAGEMVGRAGAAGPLGLPERLPPELSALLSRPLDLPAIGPGQPCPKAQGAIVSDRYGPVLGGGPVYPAGLGEEGVLTFNNLSGTAFAGSAWGGGKVLWVVAPEYHGPALIRGGRLDGAEELRFDTGLDPAASIWIPAQATSALMWRERPSYTRVLASGCYAYQVDGDDFSYTIAFEAQPETNP